jgi:hypothetical protein
VPLRETSLLATASYQLGPALGLQLAAGAILDGTIGMHAGDVRPGFAAAAAASYLAVYEEERRPFVSLSLSLAGSRASAVADDGAVHPLTAFDLRLGAMVGKTFGPLTGFAVARGFAGPVYFRVAGRDETGGDVHHYAIGAGLTARIGRRLSVAAEGLPLGERSAAISLGVGL